MSKLNYHEDETERIASERHAAIVIKDFKVLLIHRIKKGFEYYVFPGGHRRREEKPEQSVVREVEEETSVVVSFPKLAIKKYDGRLEQHDFYYLCQWVSGEEPRLNGEERFKNCQENFFEPLWVSVEKAKSLNILPVFAREWLLKNLQKKLFPA